MCRSSKRACHCMYMYVYDLGGYLMSMQYMYIIYMHMYICM